MGVLHFVGLCLDGTFGIVVFSAETEQAARELVQAP